jgi:ribosome biogenesis GTPase
MEREESPRGRVIRIRGSTYVVSSGGEEIHCSLRGRFRLGESPEEVLPVVGDDVEFRGEKRPDPREQQGLIMRILPRRSVFTRSDPAGRMKYRVIAANLDCVVIVVSTQNPVMNTRLVDRMIISAERGGMEPVICVNKMDIARDPEDMKELMMPYHSIEYRILYCSALRMTGLTGLRDLMKDRASMMVGPSGSGKTSLITALQPDLELKIQDVSEKTGKGKHTTSHFELHALDFGGYIGDSPGIREFGISGVARNELGSYFREFAPYIGGCRFATCTHSHEPSCEIKEAVQSGAISAVRYESYLRILDTLPTG